MGFSVQLYLPPSLAFLAGGSMAGPGRQRFDHFINTVKPLFIVLVQGLKKKRWIWENNRCGSLHKINKNDQICLHIFTKSKTYTNNVIASTL
jgi:hypothetical protein